LCVLILAGRASAAIMFFTDRTSFNAAAGTSGITQSFETTFPTNGTVSFPGFSMTESGTGSTPAIASADSTFAASVGLSNAITNGSRMAFFDDNDNSILTFQFGPPVNAFGVDVTSNEAQTMAISGDASTSFPLLANTPRFFGVVNTSGTFSSIVFTATGGPNVGFDAVTLPEPGSAAAALACAGLALLAGSHRRAPRDP
jgi:hypothetical protein